MACLTGNSTAQNTFSGTMRFRGPFNFSITGTWAGTVHVQRAFSGSSATWHDVDSFTANTSKVGNEPERGVYYRAGIKTGNYTSGTAALRFSQ